MSGSFGYDILELTDVPADLVGSPAATTTTINLLLSPYGVALENVDLGVAQARPGMLGGGGIYDEVDFSLTITIADCSPAAVYTALAALLSLLEQSQRWWKGHQADPIRLVARAYGSTAQPVSCVVLRPPDAPPAVVPPPAYEADTRIYVATVTIQARRRGAWLQPGERVTGAGATTGNASLATFAGGAALLSSPLRCSVVPSIASVASNKYAIILVSDRIDAKGNTVLAAANKYAIIEAESAGTDTNYAPVADSVNYARGGSVLRITGSATVAGVQFTLPSVSLQSRTTLVYAVMRANSGFASGTIALRTVTTAGDAIIQTTPQSLDLSGGQPQVVYCGTLIVPEQLTNLTININGNGAGSLDIDYFVLVNDDDETTTVVTADYWDTSYSKVIDPRPLTRPSALFGTLTAAPFDYGAPQFESPHLGDAYASMRGATVRMITMVPAGSAWRAQAGGTLVTFTPYYSRWPASLVLP